MTDCNNNVVEQSVSRSLVPQLTRGQADSLCVIYEVFDCVSVFLGVGGGGGTDGHAVARLAVIGNAVL